MSILLDALRHKVQDYLQRVGADYSENDGEYLLTRGSAAVVLYLSEFNQHVFLDFHGAIAQNIQLSGEGELALYKTLLSWNVADVFGKFALVDDQVILKYRMLADQMDFDAFCFVIDSVMEYADSLDEMVAALSNGQRHIDASGEMASVES
ncbi:MAG: T3SS (YopN, CesT) and YbjN peptide-binding chaperone 1 [Candidatus Sericytochromatia bacterium]